LTYFFILKFIFFEADPAIRSNLFSSVSVFLIPERASVGRFSGIEKLKNRRKKDFHYYLGYGVGAKLKVYFKN
jgi:arginyl-tRNA--protein-N-Asp/Glu arginylyltransferase